MSALSRLKITHATSRQFRHIRAKTRLHSDFQILMALFNKSQGEYNRNMNVGLLLCPPAVVSKVAAVLDSCTRFCVAESHLHGLIYSQRFLNRTKTRAMGRLGIRQNLLFRCWRLRGAAPGTQQLEQRSHPNSSELIAEQAHVK